MSLTSAIIFFLKKVVKVVRGVKTSSSGIRGTWRRFSCSGEGKCTKMQILAWHFFSYNACTFGVLYPSKCKFKTLCLGEQT